MEQYNLIITCKFSDFARSYVGLDDPEDYMAFIEEQDQMSFVKQPHRRYTVSHSDFLTKADLIAINDSMVEIRIQSRMKNNGIYILNLTVTTPDVNNPYNGSVIECDSAELEEMLHDIITHTFRY